MSGLSQKIKQLSLFRKVVASLGLLCLIQGAVFLKMKPSTSPLEVNPVRGKFSSEIPGDDIVDLEKAVERQLPEEKEKKVIVPQW